MKETEIVTVLNEIGRFILTMCEAKCEGNLEDLRLEAVSRAFSVSINLLCRFGGTAPE